MGRRRSLFAAAAAFFAVSLVLSFLGALLEEALFEGSRWAASVAGDMLVESTLPPSVHLPVWFVLKAIFALAIAALYVRDRGPAPGWREPITFAGGIALLVLATFGSLALVVSVPPMRWGFWAAFSCIVVGLGCAAMHLVLRRLTARDGSLLAGVS